jgi:hypothetical protein
MWLAKLNAKYGEARPQEERDIGALVDEIGFGIARRTPLARPEENRSRHLPLRLL